METKQTISNKKIQIIIGVLLGLLTLYFLFNTIVENRFQEIELNTRVQIANQQILLTAIAETTARNGADEITESIVKDCSIDERVQFDDLLGKLNKGLSRTQLVELERLFGRCGSFYSERKSVMVARLSREIEIYENYVRQLEIILNENISDAFLVEEWKALSEEEQKQSDLFAKLVILQDKIITALLAGSSVGSPEIAEILHEVREVQETLAVANKQTSNLRTELISL